MRRRPLTSRSIGRSRCSNRRTSWRHTTSRSAAVYIENEGGPVFHRLSRHVFFEAEHAELDAPLLTPLPVLKIGDDSQRDEFVAEAAEAGSVTGSIRVVPEDELRDFCPVLTPGVATVGLLEPTAASIDVMGLHQLFVRRALQRRCRNRPFRSRRRDHPGLRDPNGPRRDGNGLGRRLAARDRSGPGHR